MTDPLGATRSFGSGPTDPGLDLPVVIIGAGISGLAAATFLDGSISLRVLEAGPVPGGNVRSDIVDGRVIDQAANGWLDNEPAMGRLIEKAGLTDQLIEASSKAKLRFIFADGQLQQAPLSPPALLSTRLVGWGAKLRLLLEPFIGRGPEGGETVGAFVRRRLGAAFLDRMVAPMVAGIYAADPDNLSLRAAFERMHELERKHRSLILAAIRLRKGGMPAGRLQTLPGGAGALTRHLAERLGGQLGLEQAATSIERRRSRWRIHTESGLIDASAVVLACPGPVQARLIRGLDTEAATALEEIPYSPVAVVVTAFPKGAWERDPIGFGALLARRPSDRIEGAEGVLGTVFTSEIFPQQSRPDEVLLRTIIGGAITPEAALVSDEELIARTRTALQAFFGKERLPPNLVRIYRHERGIPQYLPGHIPRVAAVRAAQARHPGLFFVGNHLLGIGVKDCAREGERVARQVLAYVG